MSRQPLRNAKERLRLFLSECVRVGWCFAPKGYLVAGDVMLAQKIALETDERGALAVANRFFVPRGPRNTLLQH